MAGMLGFADGAQTAHGGLQNKYLRFRLAEQAHAEQRTAVPTLASFVDQQDELLLRTFSIETVELADVGAQIRFPPSRYGRSDGLDNVLQSPTTAFGIGLHESNGIRRALAREPI